MEIYVLIDNKPKGPYTRELVLQYLGAGQLRPTDLAAYAGRADWKPLSVFVRSWAQGALGKGARAPATAPPAKSSERKRVIVIVAAALVLLLGAAGFVFWRHHAKTGWGAMNVVTRAEPDWPNSFADLNAWYVEPPEGQNAATFFLKGLDAFQITDNEQKSKNLPVLGRGLWPPPGTPLSPATKASVAVLLQRNDAIWTALQQGLNVEHARYPIDLNLGSETLLPHLFKIKKVAQLGELKAVMSAEDNQSQTAVDTLLVSLAVPQSLKDEPVLISQLVRVACFSIETDSAQNVLNSVALSAADLERLSTAFAKAESAEIAGQGFTRALVGERALGLPLFDLPPDKLEKLLTETPVVGLPRNLGAKKIMQNLKGQRAFAEETLNHALAMRKEPFPGRLKVDEYMVSRASLAKNKELYICQMLLPALGKITKREAAGLANLRLVRTAIALEQFRQANAGSYPESLAVLAPKFIPEAPIDPFTGKQVRYQKTGDGYELRSTGQDPAKPISIKVVTPPKLAL